MSYFETDAEDVKATENFVNEALAIRIEELFPQLDEPRREELIKIVHDNMRTDSPSMLKKELADFDLGPDLKEAVKKIETCQTDVACAIVGLGSDIFEPGAALSVNWTK